MGVADRLEFRLLGPVEVWRGPERLAISSRHQRSVLAALALCPGRVVSVSALVDAVWEEDSPPSARRQVIKLVSRLRGTLGDAITTRSGDYMLNAEPDQVDVGVFDSSVAGARQLSVTDPEAAARAAREALRLWRGPALSGVTPGLAAQATRLEERRLSALEDGFDWELATGGHAALVAELTILVAEHPLRERLVGQLMLALHRSGRTTEALEVYRRTHERLADDLALAPGAELQQLHVAILRNDATPTAPISPPAPAPRSATRTSVAVPRQLPCAVAGFTGRASQLKELTGLLDRNDTVVISAINGTAGVGKTALAVHWSHQVADRFSDGQLYVNLRGFDPSGQPVQPADAIRGFLDALGVPAQRIPAGLAEQAALYRSQLADRRILVVLDNARDTDQVRPLLPGSAQCLTVITSRDPLGGLIVSAGARAVPLDLMTTAEAYDLLASRLGPERLAVEPHAVSDLIELCAHLPLALTIVAARVTLAPTLSLAELAKQLRDVRDRLRALDIGDASVDLSAVFSWSYRTLSAAAARMFRLLSLHPGPVISVSAAASLVGTERDQAHAALSELTRAQLLTEHSAGRFAYHDLLRAYSAGKAREDEDEQTRHAAMHRMLDHYLHTAHAATLLLNPPNDRLSLVESQPGACVDELADDEQAWQWFTAERQVFPAAIERAADAGFDTHAWQLAWSVASFCIRAGHWTQMVTSQLVAIAAAERAGEPHGQAWSLRELGRVYIRLGRYADARASLCRALDLDERLGDLVGQARSYNTLGIVSYAQGANPEALEQGKAAYALFHAAGHRAGQADALNAIGWMQTQLGQHAEALRYCAQALELHRAVGSRHGEADTWDSLGCAHHNLGEHQRAVVCYHNALELYQKLGARHPQADTLIRLGETYQDAGDFHAAHRSWQQALPILDDLHHPDADVLRARLAERTPAP
ncbi:AfsR/SARP family transcriptional regulator [Kutzneria kofuensis]|uniref:DNA-binding SARP family transcriptional activator/Tfp pilus assembly protein PilF n=1 Tax=Kutzneria kofuensis TaxID=103725 RepID=A0A7W9KSV9_9PSEU|nr:BTAD domain-containing putative transcriptional regulator [Kutzneria kofuensis]MBB5898093.1 DNA-binding SARP family transcriptional activator/Tfp pilus assembly protein PilF [Kutzneria kofuensis]